jgi:hypothetical protein
MPLWAAERRLQQHAVLAARYVDERRIGEAAVFEPHGARRERRIRSEHIGHVPGAYCMGYGLSADGCAAITSMKVASSTAPSRAGQATPSLPPVLPLTRQRARRAVREHIVERTTLGVCEPVVDVI